MRWLRWMMDDDVGSVCLSRSEKEGIPPDMLQQLDVCVEIPQQGIIRSLNVHVSGALLVWEYTRQQMELSELANAE